MWSKFDSKQLCLLQTLSSPYYPAGLEHNTETESGLVLKGDSLHPEQFIKNISNYEGNPKPVVF